LLLLLSPSPSTSVVPHSTVPFLNSTYIHTYGLLCLKVILLSKAQSYFENDILFPKVSRFTLWYYPWWYGDYWRNWEMLGSKWQLRKELLILMTISISIIFGHFWTSLTWKIFFIHWLFIGCDNSETSIITGRMAVSDDTGRK
jgi:hypothetical protein